MIILRWFFRGHRVMAHNRAMTLETVLKRRNSDGRFRSHAPENRDAALLHPTTPRRDRLLAYQGSPRIGPSSACQHSGRADCPRGTFEEAFFRATEPALRWRQLSSRWRLLAGPGEPKPQLRAGELRNGGATTRAEGGGDGGSDVREGVMVMV